MFPTPMRPPASSSAVALRSTSTIIRSLPLRRVSPPAIALGRSSAVALRSTSTIIRSLPLRHISPVPITRRHRVSPSAPRHLLISATYVSDALKAVASSKFALNLKSALTKTFFDKCNNMPTSLVEESAKSLSKSIVAMAGNMLLFCLFFGFSAVKKPKLIQAIFNAVIVAYKEFHAAEGGEPPKSGGGEPPNSP